MSGLKNLKKNDVLFREGDPSESMYVIKSGKIAITKAKGASEIVLAELGPGDMLGEMAFFDNKPRSAGAKAVVDTVLIELPFKALNAQFKTFPEWVKAVVRTVNNHLRNANTKIKNLEKTSEDDAQYFPPHLVNRLMAILGLVAARWGEKTAEGTILVPPNKLRNYCIQVFQQPTAKLDKLMEMLQSFGYMKVEDLGEGKRRLTMNNLDVVLNFVDFYNEWLFKAEDKKVTIVEKEMKTLKALIHYGKKATPDAKGEVKINITAIQAESMKELGFIFSVDDVGPLAEKKITSEAMSGADGLACKFVLKDLENLYVNWELIFAFKSVQKS